MRESNGRVQDGQGLACNGSDCEYLVGWRPYCQDPELSLERGGTLYKALYIADGTPDIDKDDRANLLACLCGFYDMLPLKPPKNASAGTKEAWNWAMMWTPAQASSST